MKKISGPIPILAPGSKVIEEYVGRASTGEERLSIAHMIAPPGWTESFQRPDFDEITIVVQGELEVDHDGGRETVRAGQAIFTEKGERVRYENTSEEFAEYWAVCLPAFSPEAAHREL
jgi:mannose-6-phosphate isomerase-like protein (cupin superfamily)